MSDNVKVSKGYESDNITCHDVTIKGETFYNVPNISKCKKCSYKTCDNYQPCVIWEGGVVRVFDCEKNANRASIIWNFVTGVLLVILTNMYYRTLSLGFFKGTAALLVTFVALDVFCCGLEKLVDIVRENYFYHKLKKRDEKQKELEEQKRLAEEAKNMREQAEADAKDPNRVKIREAENTLEQIATLSEKINFGECDEKVEFCVSKCKEIIDHLKKDNSGYIRVETLLQVYLPEFYRILAYYAEFEKAEAVEETQKNKLNGTVDYFYSFLCKQKVEAIFDKKATEIKFNAAADTLRREIEKRGGKL